MTKEEIAEVIADYLKTNELFLVDISISKDDDIEIAIESKNSEVKIENCVEIDHIVSDAFNRDDYDYSLTVTSAGLDQPFKVKEQYIKFTGQEVELIAKGEIPGSQEIKKVSGGKIIGSISAVNDEGIELSVTQMVKEPGAKKKTQVTINAFFAFDNIKSCKPVIKFK